MVEYHCDAEKDHSPTHSFDSTKCAFVIKGSCKNGESSTFEYDRPAPDAPRSEHTSATITPGACQTKETIAGGMADEAQPETKPPGIPTGVEDTTILERRLTRTLGTHPFPHSQSSSDRMLELHDMWSTRIPQKPEDLVAFRGQKIEGWNTQFPIRPRTGSIDSGAESTPKTLGNTATVPKREKHNAN